MSAKYTARVASSTVLSTTLNALATDANKITVTALSNDAASERELFGDFSLTLTATSARTKRSVRMFLLAEVDGTYSFGGDSLNPENGYAGAFNFDLSTTARTTVLQGVRIPASDYHVLLINELGVAFGATGNLLKLQTYSYEDV